MPAPQIFPAATAAAHAGSLEIVSLRFAGIHGAPRLTGALVRMALAGISGAPIKVSEPTSIFSFVFLQDACAAIRAALTAPLREKHMSINIGGGAAWSLTQWATAIAHLSGRCWTVEQIPATDARQESLDISLARQALEFVPGSVEKRLAVLIDDLRHSEVGIGRSC